VDPELSRISADLEEAHWWFTARAAILGEVGRRLVKAPARVVEVGCGTGNVLGEFPEDWSLVGVDTSAEAVAIARERFPHLDLRVGRAPEDVRDELCRADLVLFCDVLEHIEEDVATLRAVVEEIPVGAKVLITVPAWTDLWSDHDVSHGHFRRYDPDRLRAMWHGLPLETRLVSPFNWRLYPVVKVVRSISRARSKTFGPDETDLFVPAAPVNRVLRSIFRSEEGPLLRALEGTRRAPARKGVSWMVVLEKRRDDG
jgi:SAM-dependent methyltransferase